MFDLLGRAATTRPLCVCAAWLAVAVGLTLVAPDWRNQSQDDDIRFLPARCPSVRGLGTLPPGLTVGLEGLLGLDSANPGG